jgi:hypothetical protein
MVSHPIWGAGDSLRIINDLQLELGMHYGTVLPQHKSIEYSLENNIGGFEFSLATHKYGRSAWDKLFRYPRIGAGYLFTTLGNHDVFGTANAVFLFMNIPFTANQKKISASYQINFGLAYVNRLFDVVENPLNMAMSTRLNVYACFRVYTVFFINSRNELSTCFGLSHFSNGKIVSPNLGINTGSFSLGYRLKLLNPRYERITRNSENYKKTHSTEVVLSGGSKTDDQVTGKNYFISSFICDYKYNFSLKYAFGAGSDFFYDPTLGPNKVAVEGGSYTTSDLFQIGMHGAFYVKYAWLTTFVNLGSYVYANYFKYSRIYSRIGIRCEVHRHFLFNLSLKAHYAIADYIEWGIGYRF